MLKIGITGQAGFIGTHLYNTLGLYPEEFERITFKDEYFDNEKDLREFVKKCDTIVHFAAMNRHPDPDVIYNTNIELVKKLINAMTAESVNPNVIFSSSTQEENDNLYGRSKKEGRALLKEWAEKNHASFTGLIIPNVFGPFGKPNYNSFIATFCHKLVNGNSPEILVDSDVKLIYVGNLCNKIINKLRSFKGQEITNAESIVVEEDFNDKVTIILKKLEQYKELYIKDGFIPYLNDKNDINLFNTFRSYIDHHEHFPITLKQFSDERGKFIETLRTEIAGQVSISTTNPGITRGNHYHTRKIERFTVIKGKALIQLRKIGSEQVIDLYLDGDDPSYVDMPVWYTHNIKNIGEDVLITQFWINEWYNPEDADTFFEVV
jgi:UDP-2-acetamido-2,6-beta-L-arabino-hexul-4-ose reductase